MVTKKLMAVLFGVLVISAWFFGSANNAKAETLNFKLYGYGIKQEIVPIGDQEGHLLIFNVRGAFYVFENGEVATANNVASSEDFKGGGSLLQYTTLTFPDGSTIIIKGQGTIGGGVPGAPATAAFKNEIIKGSIREGKKVHPWRISLRYKVFRTLSFLREKSAGK